MRYLFFSLMLTALCSCNQNTMHVYFANGDSIFYCQSATFDANKLHKSSFGDRAFNEQLFLTASKNNCDISLKPMTSWSNGAVAESIEQFCNKIKANGLTYYMGDSDDAEKKYFDAVTLGEHLRNR